MAEKKRKKRDKDGNYLFGVVGGSCSGKTTFVKRIYEKLGYKIITKNYEGELINKKDLLIKKIFNELIRGR